MQPPNCRFILSCKRRTKPHAVGVAVRRDLPRECCATPRLSPAYFHTAAFFCGIRRNSSKTTADLCRTFIFTAEKKERGAHAVYSAVFHLCAARLCVYLIFPLARRTGRFLRLFRQRKSLPSYFFFCCNIYSVGLVLWV